MLKTSAMKSFFQFQFWFSLESFFLFPSCLVFVFESVDNVFIPIQFFIFEEFRFHIFFVQPHISPVSTKNHKNEKKLIISLNLPFFFSKIWFSNFIFFLAFSLKHLSKIIFQRTLLFNYQYLWFSFRFRFQHGYFISLCSRTSLNLQPALRFGSVSVLEMKNTTHFSFSFTFLTALNENACFSTFFP